MRYFSTGKYRYSPIADVVRDDPGYIRYISSRQYVPAYADLSQWLEIERRRTRRNQLYSLKRGYVNMTVVPDTVDREMANILSEGVEITRSCVWNCINVARANPEYLDRMFIVMGSSCGSSNPRRYRMEGHIHYWLLIDNSIVDVTPDYEQSEVADYSPEHLWSGRYIYQGCAPDVITWAAWTGGGHSYERLLGRGYPGNRGQ